MTERTIPTNLSDLTQETYDLYMKEVKAILLQMSYRQILLTPENLLAVEDYEIIAIPQASGGVLIQLRAKSGTLAEIINSVNQLTPTDRQLLKSYLNS